MSVADRRKVRREAESPEDREIAGHLATAKRELDKAMAVCSRVCRNHKEGSQEMSSRARQNRSLLSGVISQLGKVGSLKSSLSTDIDLLPEEVQAQLSREASLKRRAEAESKNRVRKTQDAVHRVLSSLGTAK